MELIRLRVKCVCVCVCAVNPFKNQHQLCNASSLLFLFLREKCGPILLCHRKDSTKAVTCTHPIKTVEKMSINSIAIVFTFSHNMCTSNMKCIHRKMWKSFYFGKKMTMEFSYCHSSKSILRGDFMIAHINVLLLQAHSDRHRAKYAE